MEYNFTPIFKCNMCLHDDSKNKILGFRLNRSQGKAIKNKKGISVSVVRCTNCGFVYSNPQPELKETKTKFNELTENYWQTNDFTINKDHYKNEFEVLKKIQSKEFNQIKVLDIGFGLGRTLHALNEKGFDAYGIEPFTSFYNFALKNSITNFDKEKIQNVDFENCNYESNQFDFIIFEAFQHIAFPNEALQKALSWLKPGGLIQIEVASSDWLITKVLNFYYKIRGSNFVSNLSPMHAPYNQHEFTLKTFEANAKLNNYTIKHVDYYVCNPYLPSFLGKIASYYMKKTKQGMQVSVWLQKK